MASIMDGRLKDVKSALCIIPPKSVWPAIQNVRQHHDDAYERWMPHINLLFPFVEDTGQRFEQVARKISELANNFQPFRISCTPDDVNYFAQGKNKCTVHFRIQTENEVLETIQKEIVDDIYPDGASVRKYIPHLTLGQCTQEEVSDRTRVWAAAIPEFSFLVSELALISRSGAESFTVKHIVQLGASEGQKEEKESSESLEEKLVDEPEEQKTPLEAVILKCPTIPEYKLVIRGHVKPYVGTYKRAVILLLDISASMFNDEGLLDTMKGSDVLESIRRGLTTFLEQVHGRPDVEVRIFMFHKIITFHIPEKKEDIRKAVEEQILGATSTTHRFQKTIWKLTSHSENLFAEYPEHEQTVVFLSDGYISWWKKQSDMTDAVRTWRTYTASLPKRQRPFVHCIGVGGVGPGAKNNSWRNLLYFVTDDGTFKRAETAEAIASALGTGAMAEVVPERRKITLKYPFEVIKNLRSRTGKKTSKEHVMFCFNDYVTVEAWIHQNIYNKALIEGEEVLSVSVDSEEINVNFVDLENYPPEKHTEMELEYYLSSLESMADQLKEAVQFGTAKIDIPDLRKELNEIEEKLMPILNDQLEQSRREVCQLARLRVGISNEKFKQMCQAIKQTRVAHKKRSKSVTKLMADVKEILGQLRRILKTNELGYSRYMDLLYQLQTLSLKRSIAKRALKLAVSDDFVKQRRRAFQNISKPSNADLMFLPSEECYLSAGNMRDAVEEKDSMWIAGRIQKHHGVGLASADMAVIEYVSLHPVTAGYFDTAVYCFSSPYDFLAPNTSASTFFDPAREEINSLLIPLYGNPKHFEYAMAIMRKQLSFALSETEDLFSTDFYQLCFSAVGTMIMKLTNSERGRILTLRSLQSLYHLCKTVQVYPFLDHTKAFDDSAEKISLLELSKSRLCRFISSPKCRTSAAVPNLRVLYCDLALAEMDFQKAKLTNLDENVVNLEEFWKAFFVQLIRRGLNYQLPAPHLEDYNALYNKAISRQNKALRILVQGLIGEKILTKMELKNLKNKDLNDEKNPEFGRQFTIRTHERRKQPAQMQDFDITQCSDVHIDAVRQGNRITDWKGAVKAGRFLRTWWCIRSECGGIQEALSYLSVDRQVIYKDERKTGDVPEKWLLQFKDEKDFPKTCFGFLQACGLRFDWVDLRAIYALSLATVNNKSWHKGSKRVDWSSKKQLRRMNKSIVKADLIELRKKAEQDRKRENANLSKLAKQKQVRAYHIGLLPDDLGNNGKLPWDRCGYTSCGMRFDDIEREEKETDEHFQKRVKRKLFAHLDTYLGIGYPSGHKCRHYIQRIHLTALQVIRNAKKNNEFLTDGMFAFKVKSELEKHVPAADLKKSDLSDQLKFLFKQLMDRKLGYAQKS